MVQLRQPQLSLHEASDVHKGAEDVERQRLNVFRMEMMERLFTL